MSASDIPEPYAFLGDRVRADCSLFTKRDLLELRDKADEIIRMLERELEAFSDYCPRRDGPITGLQAQRMAAMRVLFETNRLWWGEREKP